MAGDRPLVSVIVPVYGTEAYLPSCIDSICNQTYSHLQIILVDDQSPDRCPEICEQYATKDPRICVIHQKNKGVSGARNTGLQYAAGEYVIFVDSDDELYYKGVELLLKDALEYGADVVSAVKQVMNHKDTQSLKEDGLCMAFDEDRALLLCLSGERNTDSACAKLFKKKIIQDLHFVEGKNINEDGFFVFQCYLKKPLLIQHNAIIYKYNCRPNSNSRQNFSEKYLSILYFCERKKELIAAHFPQYIDEAHNMEVRTNLQFLDVLCRTNDRKYVNLQKQCINTVRNLYRYHKPINDHHRLLARVVKWGLFPLYKWAVRMKYHR